jgi:hypothetical protein
MSHPKSATAAEYVLGTLDFAERREFERELSSDPELQALVEDWRDKLGPIDDIAEPVEPSADLWDRISAQVDDIQTGANVVAFERPHVRRSPVRRPAAAVLGLIAASVIGVFVVQNMRDVSTKDPKSPAQIAAPAQTPAQPGQPATVTAAAPCPKEATGGIETAGAPKDYPGRPENPLSRASSISGNGAIVLGGGPKIETPKTADPQGPGNVVTASAPRDGNLAVASNDSTRCR